MELELESPFRPSIGKQAKKTKKRSLDLSVK